MEKRVGTGQKVLPTTNLPKRIDWRDKGAITTPVRQGECGSCWAFSTVAALEAYNKINGGALMRLSPQQLVDCASNDAWGNFGCDGGFVDYAFAYSSVYPVTEEKYYPYLAKQGKCNFKDGRHGVRVFDHFELKPQDPNQLKAALARGPVGISVEAEKEVFRNYKNGIINY